MSLQNKRSKNKTTISRNILKKKDKEKNSLVECFKKTTLSRGKFFFKLKEKKTFEQRKWVNIKT